MLRKRMKLMIWKRKASRIPKLMSLLKWVLKRLTDQESYLKSHYHQCFLIEKNACKNRKKLKQPRKENK